MELMTVEEILKVTGGKLLQGDIQTSVGNVSIDSRTVKEGELFLALKGERFDGHDFVDEVFRKGAGGVIISRDLPVAGGKLPFVIRVVSTLKALQNMAHHYRKKFKLPLVMITGSNGKTTTKDMIASILAEKMKLLKSEGNFNNEIGVPLTLLNLAPSHQAAVMEAGMSAPGEIACLTRLAEPQVGVITNVGRAHLRFFKDRDEIAQAKGELADNLGEEGAMVLNKDDYRVWSLGKRVRGKLVSFAIEEDADFRAGDVENLADGSTRFTISASGEEEVEIALPVPGYVNVYNALAAAAVVYTLGFPLSVVKEGLEKFKSSPQRLKIVSLTFKGGSREIRVIDDTYNANPESMKSALNLLNCIKAGGKKIAVLGDMLELGETGREAHREVGRMVLDSAPDILIVVGSLSPFIVEAAKENGFKGKTFNFDNSREAGNKLAEMLEDDDLILVKGSRAMRMEEALNVLSSLS